MLVFVYVLSVETLDMIGKFYVCEVLAFKI